MREKIIPFYGGWLWRVSPGWKSSPNKIWYKRLVTAVTLHPWAELPFLGEERIIGL